MLQLTYHVPASGNYDTETRQRSDIWIDQISSRATHEPGYANNLHSRINDRVNAGPQRDGFEPNPSLGLDRRHTSKTTVELRCIRFIIARNRSEPGSLSFWRLEHLVAPYQLFTKSSKPHSATSTEYLAGPVPLVANAI